MVAHDIYTDDDQANIPQWWGNVTVFETMVSLFLQNCFLLLIPSKDATMTAIRKTVRPGEMFGPSTWSWA